VKKVTKLITFVDTSEYQTAKSFRYYHFLLESIPSLEESIINGYQEPARRVSWLDARIMLQEGLTTPRFANLTSLLLKLVDLGKSSEVLFGNIQFPGLVKLSLAGCHHMAIFMNALLEYYSKNEKNLFELAIALPWHSSEPAADIQAIEHSLKDGPKLLDLEIDVSHHALRDKDCFISQAKSLESLVLGTGRAQSAKMYGVEHMKAILKACQQLKHLAVNLPEVRLGPIMDLADKL
jgi:hypothetical protein